MIAEVGLSRVYREVHLMRSGLAELVSPETLSSVTSLASSGLLALGQRTNVR